MIIDATNSILGRFATKAAKAALEGEKVIVINCENAYIVGNKKDILKRYFHLINMGSKPNKGPFIPRRPDRYVKRAIKGMLPKSERGRLALKKVKCYIGQPEEIKGEAKIIKEASIINLRTPNRMKLGDLCKQAGWKN